MDDLGVVEAERQDAGASGRGISTTVARGGLESVECAAVQLHRHRSFDEKVDATHARNPSLRDHADPRATKRNPDEALKPRLRAAVDPPQQCGVPRASATSNVAEPHHPLVERAVDGRDPVIARQTACRLPQGVEDRDARITGLCGENLPVQHRVSVDEAMSAIVRSTQTGAVRTHVHMDG